jgi:PAS domain S-box-containing protein
MASEAPMPASLEFTTALLARLGGTILTLRLGPGGEILEASQAFQELFPGWEGDPRPLEDFLEAGAMEAAEGGLPGVTTYRLLGSVVPGARIRALHFCEGDGGVLIGERILPASTAALDALTTTTNELARLNREAQKTFRASERSQIERLQRTLDRLHASESKYRRLYETMRDGFSCADLDGRILEANQAFQDMLGYSIEELRTLTFLDLTPERWHESNAYMVREQLMRRGYSDLYEKELRRKDGSVFPVNLRAFLQFDEAGEPVSSWAIVRDITESKRGERAVQESLQSTEAILHAAPEVAFLMTPEGLVIAANGKLAKHLAQPGADLVGRSIYDFLPPERRDQWKSFADKAVQSCITAWFEDVRQDRMTLIRIVPVAEGARRVTRLAVFGTDITVFRWVEAELEVQRDLHSALRASNEALLRGGDRETLCRGVCAAAVGSGCFDLAWVGILGPDDRLAVFASAGPAEPYLECIEMASDGALPFWQAPAAACIRSNQSCVSNDYAAHSALSPWSERAVALGLGSSVSMPVREAGRCFGALNLYAREPDFFRGDRAVLLEQLATNLSFALDLRAAEEREHEHEALLRSLEGLKAKSQIAAYIAHEINNPLAGITQSFQVLAQAIPEDHPDHPFVAIITRELDRIASIVRAAYSIHRPGLPQVRDACAADILADLAHLLISKLRAKNLVLDRARLDPRLKGRLHEDILRQILFNVLQNAIEATPPHGRISCGSWREEGDLVVEVENEGPGIAPEVAPRVFESGFTTKLASEMGGLGMGLSTCRSILQSVGGSIGFRNLAPGSGVCFWVRLPWQA